MSGHERRISAPESSARDGRARYSGIELLRVLAACAVVFLHYNDGRAFVALRTLDNQYWLANKLLLYFGESLCICAVDLFILISGFFLSGSGRRSADKPLRLLLQVVLFRLGMYLARCVKGSAFSLRSLLFCFVPVNYFVVLYCALYFISPYINRAVAGFGKKEWRTLLLIALLIFSVYQTGVDVFQEIVGRQIMGLSPIGAWGGQQGFNIVNFCLMYIIGAYLRHCGCVYGGGYKKPLLVFLACAGIVFAWAIANDRMHLNGLRSAWLYHNPLVILLAVSVFAVFRGMRFESAFINRIARASFTCFLLHGYLLPFARIDDFVRMHPLVLSGHCIVTVLCCYMISVLVYEVYNLIAGGIFKRFRFKNITYYSDLGQ